MRRVALFLGVMSAVLGAFVACGGFETDTTPLAPDGGVDGTTPPLSIGDTGGGNPVDPVDASEDAPVVDAGPCGHCRSGLCYEADAGCFPLAFTTQEKYVGSFGGGGLVRADEICATDGNVNWKGKAEFGAWLSTTTENAITRLSRGHPGGAQRPVVLVDGTVVVASYREMVMPGALVLPINLAADGAIIPPSDHVWTGTNETGGLSGPQCVDWRDNTNAYEGRYGLITDRTWRYFWTEAGQGRCDGARHLYCFEQVR